MVTDNSIVFKAPVKLNRKNSKLNTSQSLSIKKEVLDWLNDNINMKTWSQALPAKIACFIGAGSRHIPAHAAEKAAADGPGPGILPPTWKTLIKLPAQPGQPRP